MTLPIGVGPSPARAFTPGPAIQRNAAHPTFVASKSTLPPGLSGMNAKEVNHLITHAKQGMNSPSVVDHSGMSGLAPSNTICGKIQRAMQAKMTNNQKIAAYVISGALKIAMECA